MSDWSQQSLLGGGYVGLSTIHEGSPAMDLALATNLNANGSGTWPAASACIYTPVLVPARVTVNQIAWQNGGTVSGSVDAGVYDSAGNLLVSAGSTAQSGTSALQKVSLTSTTISPGLYYLAMAMNNTTGTVFRFTTGSAVNIRAVGVVEQASTFPLPSTASFSGATHTTVPVLIAGTTLVTLN